MKTIKVSFPQNNTKVLVKASYDDYLSVDIKQCIVEGKTIPYWAEGKEAIKDIDRDLYDLCSLHLAKVESVDQSFISNAKCYAKKCKEQLGKTLYTSEMWRQDLKNLRNKIDNHKVFEKLFKDFGKSITSYIKEYTKESSDLFNYKDFSKSFDHWDEQLRPKAPNTFGYVGTKNTKKISTRTLLKGFFETLEEYRDLQNKYKFKTLPTNSDLWDCERLANFYNCDVLKVYELMCAPDEQTFNSKVETLVQVVADERKKRLEGLLNKYELI